MGVCGQRHAPGRFTPRERPGTHCIGGWMDPRAGLERCGKSRSTGIRTPDRPARSESLYRLSYPAPPQRPRCSGRWTVPSEHGKLNFGSSYERRLISNAHSEISRKRDHVFKQTKAGSKVQYFSYKLTCLFFDIVALSFNTFFPK